MLQPNIVYFNHLPESKLQSSHSHGKSWKKVVMESCGKVMEDSKNSEFYGNLFARKKSPGNQLSKSA